MDKFSDVIGNGKNIQVMHHRNHQDNQSCFYRDHFDELAHRCYRNPIGQRYGAIADVHQVIAQQEDFIGTNAKFLVMRNQRRYEHITVAVADFPDHDNDVRSYREVNGIADKVEVHGKCFFCL